MILVTITDNIDVQINLHKIDTILLVNIGQVDISVIKQRVKDIARANMITYRYLVIFPPPEAVNQCVLRGLGQLYDMEVITNGNTLISIPDQRLCK